jgi:hypothetical protein
VITIDEWYYDMDNAETNTDLLHQPNQNKYLGLTTIDLAQDIRVSDDWK